MPFFSETGTAIFRSIRRTRPLIHLITNPVTMNDVVNLVLASGATAICADSPEEAAEISGLADATVLNIGMPSESKAEAMLAAGEKANELGHPLILDPVGAGASDFRQRILKTLLERLHFTCIRGNQSEMAALLGVSYPSRGVEEAGVCLEPDRLQELSERYDTVLAVTGETDLTVSKDRILVSHTGTPLQKRITGSGCMLSGLLAAALAGSTAPSSGPALRLGDTSGIASLVHETVKAYGCLASEAEKEMEASSSHGTMAFRSRLIDAVSTAGL